MNVTCGYCGSDEEADPVICHDCDRCKRHPEIGELLGDGECQCGDKNPDRTEYAGYGVRYECNVCLRRWAPGDPRGLFWGAEKAKEA